MGEQFCIGQCALDLKSNQIPRVQELHEMLQREGAVVDFVVGQECPTYDVKRTLRVRPASTVVDSAGVTD